MTTTDPSNLPPIVVEAGDWSIATAGAGGFAHAGDWGVASAGSCGRATAGSHGAASAGAWGAASADVRGTASAGPNGVICVYYYDHDGVRLRVAIGYVGEDGILPDIPYRVQDGKLVPATTLDKETP